MARRFITGLLSGGIAGAKTGNPYVAAGGALLGGALSALAPTDEYDAGNIRRAQSRYRDTLLRQGRETANEVGSQFGSNHAARGLQGGLSQGIIAGNRRQVQQSQLDKVAELDYRTEMGIAAGENQANLANIARDRQDVSAVAGQAFGLVNSLSNPRHDDPQGIRKLRTALKMKNVAPFDLEKVLGMDSVDIGGGIQVRRDSPVGKLFGMNSSFWNELAKTYSGGMHGLVKLLNGGR